MRFVVRLLVGAVGALLGTMAALVGLQLIRLRRMRFLPGHPGFYVNHIVRPASATPGAPVLRMAIFGDSTTSGVGVDRVEDSLPHLLAVRVADARRRPVHVVSYGWAGARVADLPASQLPRAMEPLRTSETDPFLPGADVVIVVIGANDATHHTQRAGYREQLRDSLARIRASAPDADVVLAGIPPLRGALPQMEPLIFLAEQRARLLRPVGIAEAARAGVRHADLSTELPKRVGDRRDVLASDRFHPSAAGYRAWAEIIGDALLDDTADNPVRA